MGQIKNIKLHIVTDIKSTQEYHPQQTTTMRYVSAYLLCSLGGNESPTTSDIKSVLESVGVGYDEERAEIVVNHCKGKSIAELIAAGSEKMASMPAGGGGGSGSAGGASGGGGEDTAAAVEEKKEEKKEDSESGSDDDMGFGLFDRRRMFQECN